MRQQLSLLGLLIFIFSFSSCNNNDEGVEGISISRIQGLVEKGPFVSGSSVSVYELDDNLNATGRVFETKTDNEGAFSINPSTSFISKYVKLSVNGFYFNEYTGYLSTAPIAIEAITSIDDPNNTKFNVNILTHLEMPRVIKLVSMGKRFQEAKEQAQKELLKAFLITDESFLFEGASITGNNTAANILIAISSILLNERSDAKFTEFMSMLRNDLIEGEVSQEISNKIAESSLRLSYSRIKKNIKRRYEELGKIVEVGDFEKFIDGDGDGNIGGSYEEDQLFDNISENSYFSSEENLKAVLNGIIIKMHSFIQRQYVFDAVFTNTVSSASLAQFSELKSIYEHNLTSSMNTPYDLWSSAYQAISNNNVLIEGANGSNQEWYEKYLYIAKTYRAYMYLNMINLWGDVPFVISSDLSNINPSRTPQNEILNFIIDELEKAYLHLPESGNQRDCSKYFAKAVQAKAYLYMKEYKKALECTQIIINSGKYSLSNDISSIYTGGSAENILEWLNSENNLSKAFKELVQKGNNIGVVRYAEILLIAAETNMKLGNNTQSIHYLNQVRKRNGRSLLNDLSSIEEALLNEWKEDLLNEGVYFSTLKRLGKATTVLNIPEYKLLMPIPESEISLNQKIKQNPGY